MRDGRYSRRWRQWLALSAMLALAACGATPQQPAPTAYPAPPGAPPTVYPAPPGVAPTAYPPPPGGTAATPTPPASSPAVPSPVPAATPAAPGASGEVPAAKLAAAVADLARRTGVDPAQIVVVSAEAVTWSDGSLGCPQPGMFYPQVLVEGYRLVLAVNGARYSYHAAADGDFFSCERPTP